MAPTFAAGSITGEKERKTYELLLASPLRPSTILVGKLMSSLSYLVILIVSSLPLMILCYLLGGLLLSEITRSYLVLILAAGTFGLVSVACSSYFRRTSSALVVSYLVILPLAVLCVVMTRHRQRDRPRLRFDRDLAPVVSGRLDRPGNPRQSPLAAPARRRQRGQGRGRRRRGNEVRDRRRDRPRPVPRQAVRPRQAHGPDARRHQSGPRQGAPQRDLQPGNPDAARGDPGQHAAVDSAHGRRSRSCGPTRPAITWPTCSRSTSWSAPCFPPGASPRNASGRP